MEFQGGDPGERRLGVDGGWLEDGSTALSFSLEGKALERKYLLRRYRRHDL
ncbi:hypothetical protein V3C99_007698 [Haemonchus contortus]